MKRSDVYTPAQMWRNAWRALPGLSYLERLVVLFVFLPGIPLWWLVAHLIAEPDDV